MIIFASTTAADFRLGVKYLSELDMHGRPFRSVTRKQIKEFLKSRKSWTYVDATYPGYTLRKTWKISVNEDEDCISIGCVRFTGRNALEIKKWALR